MLLFDLSILTAFIYFVLAVCYFLNIYLNVLKQSGGMTDYVCSSYLRITTETKQQKRSRECQHLSIRFFSPIFRRYVFGTTNGCPLSQER